MSAAAAFRSGRVITEPGFEGSERIIADCAVDHCADKQNEGAMGVAAIAAAAIDRDHISRVDAARSFCRKNQHAKGVARGDTIIPAKAGRSEVDDGSRGRLRM